MDTSGVDEIVVRTTSSARKEATHRRSSGSNGKPRKPANLACLNCRPRKIKCNRVDGACERCRMLNLSCKVPDRDERKLRYSKEYIEGLENEIAELRRALDQVRNSEPATSPTTLSHCDSNGTTRALQDAPSNASPEQEGSPSDNLIDRLCGMKRRVNSNTDGQARYFGPTSCLHFTETPASITSYSNSIGDTEIDLDKGIPEALQQYLLDLYWSYQHSVLPVVHKEAFLAGLQTGRGPYYSRCLLLSLLAAGARISARPQIRNLSIPVDDVDKEVRRPLTRQAEEALEREITNPSVTTIQSLLLLSVVQCGQSNDSKGWMLSGNACRLVFDLGLHQDWTYFSATKLTEIDIEVRQVVFWGCFGLDRLWALYLGRPPFIKLTDVSIRQPDRNARTWDLRIFAAWVRLLDIAGQIGDKLNTNACTQGQIDRFQESLCQWEASLEPALSFDVHANPALYHLHMQYSAMTILLNRHNAGFGSPEKRNGTEAARSRQECLHHAFRIAHMLQGYKSQHGEAYTMVGSALYNTTMAATTLVAELSETRKEGSSDELICLMTCLRTMKEMEHTELVAKNVYNIVQTIMRVCNVRHDDGAELELLSMSMPAQTPRSEPLQLAYDPATTNLGLNQTTLAMWPAFDFEGVDMEEPFPFAFEQPCLAAESASCLPSMQFM